MAEQLTRYGQETIINFNEAETTASVYTHNKALIRKLDKLEQERPGDCHREKTSHDGESAEFIIPKSWVKINPSRRLSEAQKEQLRKASKGTRFSKKNGVDHHNQDNNRMSEGSYIPEGQKEV